MVVAQAADAGNQRWQLVGSISVNDWGSSGVGDDGGESVDVNGSSNVVRLNFLLLDIFQFGNQTFDNV